MENERKTSRGEIERYDLEILLRRPSLRMNIPRRTSQACREAVQTKETTCGIRCIRGQWLQSFANTKVYIFTYEVLGCFCGSYYAYFYSTITTLEKRFNFPSTLMGTTSTVGDVIQIFMYLVWSFCMPKIHRPRWMGFGIFIVIGSTIVSSLPHFLYSSELPKYQENSSYPKNGTFETENKTCHATSPEWGNDGAEERTLIILLYLARILHGIGGSLYFSLGISYNDDNIKIYQSPAFISLLSMLKILGPAFGYWLSSMCLKIFVSPMVIPDTKEGDPRWIGAWWLGNLMIGFMLLLPATMIILFPTTLPKAAVRKVLDGLRKRTHTDSAVMEGKMEKMKRLIFDLTLNCNNFAGFFNIIGFLPYFIFLPKYAETQFRLSASNANLITGSVTLIFSAFGLVMASSIITRYRPTARALAAWNIFVGILSIGCFISYIYVGCPENDGQIKTLVSQISRNDSTTVCKCYNTSLTLGCNKLEETFTSVCHAECKSIHYSNKTKVNIHCKPDQFNSSKTKLLFEHDCEVDCHLNFVLFAIITCSMSFINATGRTSYFLFQKKYEKGQQGSEFLKVGITIFKLFAFIPYPILYGYILDQSCSLWEKTCNGRGNCWLYDTEKLRYIMNVTAIGFTATGIIFDIGIWYLVKNFVLFDDDDGDYDHYYYDDDNPNYIKECEESCK